MDDYVEVMSETKVSEHDQISKISDKPKKRKRLRISRVFLIIVIILIIAAAIYYDETISYADKLIKNTGLAGLITADSGIAATIDGEVITMEELNKEYEKVPEIIRAFTSKSEVLDKLINQKLLLSAVAEAGIEVSEEEIDESIEEIKTINNLSDEEFKQKLQEINMTIEELREQTKRLSSIEKYFEELVFKDIEITGEEIENYYTENIDLFKIDNKVTVAHILVSTENRTDDEALEIIEEIKSKLDKEVFSRLVEQYSEDPAKTTNQGVYTFGQGEMVPEFEQAAFELKNSEISEPVKTAYGYHLIKLLAKDKARTIKLDKVKEEIKEMLDNQKKEEKVKALIDELREKADVKVYYEEQE